MEKCVVWAQEFEIPGDFFFFTSRDQENQKSLGWNWIQCESQAEKWNFNLNVVQRIFVIWHQLKNVMEEDSIWKSQNLKLFF